MTKYILLFVSAFIVLGTTAQEALYSTNYYSSINKAKKNKKYTLVYFTESENAISDSNKYEPMISDIEMKEMSESKYNVVLINKSNSKYNTLIKKYNITYFPTYLFVNYNQQLIHKRIGVIKTKEVISLLENVVENKNTLRSFQKIEKANPKKLNYLDYANARYEAGMTYDKYIKKYFASIDESTYNMPENMNAFYRFVNDIYSNEFAYFVQNKDFPEENLNYSTQEYTFRVEDVISNHIIDAKEKDKNIIIEDTLNILINHFGIEDIASLQSNVMLYNFKYINKNNDLYISTLPTFINTHINIISNKELAIYCSEIVEINNEELLNKAHVWMLKVLKDYPTIENYYTDYQLLIKLEKHEEANTLFNYVSTKNKDQFSKEWKTKFYYAKKKK